jgi:hypothetical protein
MKDIKAKLQQVVESGYQGKSVTIYGEQHDFIELCKEHDIELPKVQKPKKEVNTKEEQHADMEETLDKGSSK